MSKIEEIEKLKTLLDEGRLSKEQYNVLLGDIIGDNSKKMSKEEQLLAEGAITKDQFDILIKQTNSHKSSDEVVTDKDDEAKSYDCTSILKQFFDSETPYESKKMELLKYSSDERKQLILDTLCINEALPQNSPLKVNALDEMLFFFDDSLWKNAKGGMLITDKAIFSRQYAYYIPHNDRLPSFTSWEEIVDIVDVTISSDGTIFVVFAITEDSASKGSPSFFGSKEEVELIYSLFDRFFNLKAISFKSEGYERLFQ